MSGLVYRFRCRAEWWQIWSRSSVGRRTWQLRRTGRCKHNTIQNVRNETDRAIGATAATICVRIAFNVWTRPRLLVWAVKSKRVGMSSTVRFVNLRLKEIKIVYKTNQHEHKNCHKLTNSFVRRNWIKWRLLDDWRKDIMNFTYRFPVKRNSEFYSKTSIMIRVTTCFVFKKTSQHQI